MPPSIASTRPFRRAGSPVSPKRGAALSDRISLRRPSRSSRAAGKPSSLPPRAHGSW